MAKKTNAFEYKTAFKASRPGVNAKTKTSNHKQSKHYKKIYRGQGR